MWSETVTVCCVCRGCSSTCLIRTTRWWTMPLTRSSESTTGWFISLCPSFSSTAECSLTTQQESSRWTLLMRRSWPPHTLKTTTHPQNHHTPSKRPHTLKTTTHPQNHHISSKPPHILKTTTYPQNHHIPSKPPHILKTTTYPQYIHRPSEPPQILKTTRHPQNQHRPSKPPQTPKTTPGTQKSKLPKETNTDAMYPETTKVNTTKTSPMSCLFIVLSVCVILCFRCPKTWRCCWEPPTLAPSWCWWEETQEKQPNSIKTVQTEIQ